MSTFLTLLNIYVAGIFVKTLGLLGILFRAVFRGGSFLFVWTINIVVGGIIIGGSIAIYGGGLICTILSMKPLLIGPILYHFGIFPDFLCEIPPPL